MGLPKGRTNNPNGRPQGSSNKVTTDLRNFIQDILNMNAEKIQSDIESLEPRDRLKFLVSLLPYIVPKPQSTPAPQEDVVIKIEGMTQVEVDNMIKNLGD